MRRFLFVSIPQGNISKVGSTSGFSGAIKSLTFSVQARGPLKLRDTRLWPDALSLPSFVVSCTMSGWYSELPARNSRGSSIRVFQAVISVVCRWIGFAIWNIGLLLFSHHHLRLTSRIYFSTASSSALVGRGMFSFSFLFSFFRKISCSTGGR